MYSNSQIRRSKQRGCKNFDLRGGGYDIFDERSEGNGRIESTIKCRGSRDRS
jgi:hypothetical protein